ncbi:hypothetical protein [Thermoflavimicrobium dichotomicum]|uniref:Holin n=1 Tax=Thermoflavimicrobium dichotomicum TaxID=46223 RepID=A0A1I3UL29_9BACL|nr:hypothetical protein [Thermoflavimicrobium dichotomicum]SFJ83419.1 hypothetical protein SAMN05421852_12552 [Thermoflavimicrobium dichotomicum]
MSGKEVLNKLRDPKTWGLMFAFVKLLLAGFGINITPEKWQLYEQVFNAACGVAVALGIFVYNPDAGQEDNKQHIDI